MVFPCHQEIGVRRLGFDDEETLVESEEGTGLSDEGAEIFRTHDMRRGNKSHETPGHGKETNG